MYLEVKQWPESQDVMNDQEWFTIMTADPDRDIIGDHSYCRIIDFDEELHKIALEKYEDDIIRKGFYHAK